MQCYNCEIKHICNHSCDATMSLQLDTYKEQVLWFSKGDNFPFWSSDEDGNEIHSAETYKKLKQRIDDEITD